MCDKYSLNSIPRQYTELGLGKLVGAFSSKNAKEQHPFYNYHTYIALFGLFCLLVAFIMYNMGSKNSTIFNASVMIGSLIICIFGISWPIKMYVNYRNKNHFIKNIYIFEGGFIWEAYKDDVLKIRHIFNYSEGVDIDLERTNTYVYGIYKNSAYKLTVSYYDFKKEKWRKFKLYAEERNRKDDPEKFKWDVISMRLIYSVWLSHK